MVNMIKGTLQEIAFNVAEANLVDTANHHTNIAGWSSERTIFVLGSHEVVCVK